MTRGRVGSWFSVEEPPRTRLGFRLPQSLRDQRGRLGERDRLRGEGVDASAETHKRLFHRRRGHPCGQAHHGLPETAGGRIDIGESLGGDLVRHLVVLEGALEPKLGGRETADAPLVDLDLDGAQLDLDQRFQRPHRVRVHRLKPALGHGRTVLTFSFAMPITRFAVSTILRSRGQTDDYVEFCKRFQQLTEIDLLQYKRAQMERRIRGFVDRRGVTGLGDYLKMIEASNDELDGFLDCVTINVSQLWRNPEVWAALTSTILPKLAEEGPIRAWSAGCSYGAEAYTLTATCLDAVSGTRIDVLGTDIDKRMVERARRGAFSAEDGRSAPSVALQKWFVRDGDSWSAKDDLRRHVRFETGDLLVDPVVAGSFDLILCRNVVIYLDDEVRDKLHRRLARALRPGGYLVVGSTERVAVAAECGLTSPQPFIYRKS